MGAATTEVTDTDVVTTLAGVPGQQGSSNGTGSAASFENPYDVAVDSAGNVYVADTGNDEIRKITPAGAVTTLAGMPGQSGSTDGTGSAARFGAAVGVAVDSAGNVYVADRNNDEIREISPSGVVTTLAGIAGDVGSHNGPESTATFDFPTSVAVDNAGNVYVSEYRNNDVRKIAPSGMVSTLASGLADPGDIAVDSAGNVYVADQSDDVILKITPSGVVTTFAGLSGQSGSNDGTVSTATFNGWSHSIR
jgi:streptogramin lyase